MVKCYTSNKDPKEVCNLYSNYPLIAKGVPRKIVADRGSENVNIAGSQRFLRQNHSDDSSGYRSFQFGKSMMNQRIESFCSLSYVTYVQIDGFLFSKECCTRGYAINNKNDNTKRFILF